MTTIRLRLLLVTLLSLVTIMLTVVVMWAYSNSFKKQELSTLKQLAYAVSSGAASMIIDSIIEEDYEQMAEIVEGYSDNHLIMTVRIVNEKRRILADSTDTRLGAVLAEVPLGKLDKNEKPRFFIQQLKYKLILTRSLTFDDELFGYVILEISKKPMLAHQRQMQAEILFVGITVCCFSFVGSWFIALWLIRPLEQMTFMAEAISRGESAPGIKSSAIREIEYLAKAFQRMDQKIAKREKALKETAEALRVERERLAVTLGSIGDGVISIDINETIILVNRAAEEMTGWSEAEARTRPFSEIFCLVNPKTGRQDRNFVQQVQSLENPTGQVNDTLLVSRDGTRRNITGSGSRIYDEKDEAIGVVFVFHDVTDLLRMEQDRLRVKQLESLGTLAGGIAHDFNNILAAILGNINLAMVKSSNLDEQFDDYLDSAAKACLRAKGLTAQLLTFAKGGSPVKKFASIDEIVMESADFVLHGSKAACTYHIDDQLWRAEVDKGQISQVVQNLVINADQAMTHGGEIVIRCENCHLHAIHEEFAKKHERYVKIIVSDTGAGIPADIVEKIFDPYFTTKKRGSGLGLAVCHSILAKHDGGITARSTQGVGTAFTIYLPATESDQVESVATEEAISKDMAHVKIMLMDDDNMVRIVGGEMLKHLGHEVVLACDGQEAILQYTSCRESGEPVELCIMDLTVPGGIGGKEAAEQILAIDPKARIIVSSGYSNDPVMANFQSYGLAGAMSKPYMLQDMVKGIERAFALPR